MKPMPKGAAVFFNPSRADYVPQLAYRIMILLGRCLAEGRALTSNVMLTDAIVRMSPDIVKPGWRSVMKSGTSKTYLQEEIEWILTYLRHAGLLESGRRDLTQQSIDMVQSGNWTDIKTVCDDLLLFDKADSAAKTVPITRNPAQAKPPATSESPSWLVFIRRFTGGLFITPSELRS